MSSLWWTSPERWWVKKRRRQALMVGLDDAGKSSVLSALPQVRDRMKRYVARRPQNDDTLSRPLFIQPTTDLQLVELTMWRESHSGRCFTLPSAVHWRIWDLSGQGRHRPLWFKFCRHDLDAVIWVVDASDLERAAVARDELQRLFRHSALQARGLPVLVLSNKTDKERTLSLAEVTRLLALEELANNHRLQLEVFEVSALKGTDVEKAFQWVTDHVPKREAG